MRLLIAEDDVLHRTFVKSAAESVLVDLVTIEEAENGEEAIRLFKSKPFDLVVIDLQMPKINGIEAAKEIWRIEPKTRILFWSNYSEEAYVRGITKIVPTDTVYGYVLKSASEDRLQLAMRGVFLWDQCVVDREVRGVQQKTQNRAFGLTETEYSSLIDLSLGLTDKAIAERRNISLRGAQSRLQQLYMKLGLEKNDIPQGSWGMAYNTRSRAISIALTRGLLNAETLRHEEIDMQAWMRNFLILE